MEQMETDLIVQEAGPDLDPNVVSGFGKLPPEMVTEILERLQDSPESLLSCRLVCTQFRHLLDEILERRQMSLWSWTRSHGEGNPTTAPGPIRRPPTAGKRFQDADDIDNYLTFMKDHIDSDLNPFPNRGIYIRRIRKNPPFSPEILNRTDGGNPRVDDRSLQIHAILIRSLGGPQDQSEDQPRLLPIPKILHLLTPFGVHLTSLILEYGVIADLASVQDLASILETTPNLQCLLLKGLKTDPKKEPDALTILPHLEHLKSIKVVQCSGVTKSILNSYHSQVKTLQLINHRDCWFPHFDKLQREKNGNIFGRLRELKLGEFQHPSEFDCFAMFLKAQEEMGYPLTKLERLAIHYYMLVPFENPTEKMFQCLGSLPRLVEFSVGKCGNTGFGLDQEEQSKTSPMFTCGAKNLEKISLPVQWIRHPGLLRRTFRRIGGLRQVSFVDCDGLLWGSDVVCEKALGLPAEVKLETVLKEVLGLEGVRSLGKVKVVSCMGDEERLVCAEVKTTTE